MTAEEYRGRIQALGLTQNAAARFLGVSPRASRRFADGTQAIPHAIDALLRIMIAYDVSVEEACRLAGIDCAMVKGTD